MPLSSKELQRIAKSTVINMAIGTKPNPGIEKARKRFGKLIDKLIRMKEFSKKQLNQKEMKIIEKLKDPDFGPLIIERGNKYFVKTRVGEAVRLVYSDTDKDCIKLAKLIMGECWKRGAHVTDLTDSSAESRRQLKMIPFDTAAELPLVSKLFAGAYDARIFLGGDEDIYWIRGLEEKIKVGAPASLKIHQIMDRKKVRWCYFGWPIKKKSGQLIVPFNKYKRIFYESVRETFSPKVKKLCNYYKKHLEGGDVIRITAKDGTDLTFSIKGRKVIVADGVMDEEDIKKGDVGLNIPDGEIFVSPLEYSANGYILFDWVVIHGFGLVKNLKVKFKNGKVVWFDSPQKKIFKKFLDSNTGEKDRIAELGIGVNIGARFIGETIVDEKVFGSLHVAIGNNTGVYGGVNKSSSHQDMVKIMRGRDGKIFVDNKLIMKNGMPVGLKFMNVA